ncbi:hypothetical protein [Rhizobium sp. J15]|uniref:hypothetical protein n=1 Tax=Rhizobium sp. J15 TaxID=2035450 RepID=UPI00114255DD|nr:hypothetical protein [Rhizobium sp. J15]
MKPNDGYVSMFSRTNTGYPTTKVAWTRPDFQQATDANDCTGLVCRVRVSVAPVAMLPTHAYPAETMACIQSILDVKKAKLELIPRPPEERGAKVRFTIGGLARYLALKAENKYEKLDIIISYFGYAGSQGDMRVQVAIDRARFGRFDSGYLSQPPEDRLNAFDMLDEEKLQDFSDVLADKLTGCIGGGLIRP